MDTQPQRPPDPAQDYAARLGKTPLLNEQTARYQPVGTKPSVKKLVVRFVHSNTPPPWLSADFVDQPVSRDPPVLLAQPPPDPLPALADPPPAANPPPVWIEPPLYTVTRTDALPPDFLAAASAPPAPASVRFPLPAVRAAFTSNPPAVVMHPDYRRQDPNDAPVLTVFTLADNVARLQAQKAELAQNAARLNAALAGTRNPWELRALEHQRVAISTQLEALNRMLDQWQAQEERP